MIYNVYNTITITYCTFHDVNLHHFTRKNLLWSVDTVALNAPLAIKCFGH